MKSSTKVVVALLLGFSAGWIACIDVEITLVFASFPLLSWPFVLISLIPFSILIWFILSAVCTKAYWTGNKETAS